jgi:hypothetical protein
MRVLEEYDSGRAGVLTMYGLDSGEVARLGGEIANKLKGMDFRIPTILEIRDEHHIEENIYLINSITGYTWRG